MNVFVYGTLKSGYGNNRLLSKSSFISDAIVEDVKLYHAGFPVARESKGDSSLGELWDIGDDKGVLASLDSLEGEGRMYNRKEVLAKAPDGTLYACHMYIGHPEFWEFADGPTSQIHRDTWMRSPILPCPTNEEGYYVWSR